VETYKIEYPPLSSADGLHWEEIELPQENAAPLIASGIISKKVSDAVEPKKTKPTAKPTESNASLSNGK
jgi:hypothetical protein